MFDNSGEKKKVIAGLDYHAWPVHKDEVEDDKIAPIVGWEFMHKLNQNLIQWEHDYYYFFMKGLNIWGKITKLTSLTPSPTTTEGKIYINKKKYDKLNKKFKILEKKFQTQEQKFQTQEEIIQSLLKRVQQLENKI